MTKEEAINEIEKVFEPAFANYIITALTEGATSSDKEEQPTTKNVLIQLKDEIHDKGFNSPLMNPIFTYTEILEMIDKYIIDIENTSKEN